MELKHLYKAPYNGVGFGEEFEVRNWEKKAINEEKRYGGNTRGRHISRILFFFENILRIRSFMVPFH